MIMELRRVRLSRQVMRRWMKKCSTSKTTSLVMRTEEPNAIVIDLPLSARKDVPSPTSSTSKNLLIRSVRRVSRMETTSTASVGKASTGRVASSLTR